MLMTVDQAVTTARQNGHALAAPVRHPECGSHPGRWYCVQAYQGRESEVRERIEAQGFAAFLPIVTERRRGKIVTGPAFPGYLFARFDIARSRWRCIASTRGVKRLFGSSPECPTPVPQRAMDVMLAEGFAKPLGKDLVQALDLEGQRLRVTDPSLAFCDHVGVCQWSGEDRVRLMLSMLGRDVLLDLAADQVERVLA